MIIISSRKFRDSQKEYFKKALTEDVILTTVHYGSFKLVPVVEGEPRKDPIKPERITVSDGTKNRKRLKQAEVFQDEVSASPIQAAGEETAADPQVIQRDRFHAQDTEQNSEQESELKSESRVEQKPVNSPIQNLEEIQPKTTIQTAADIANVMTDDGTEIAAKTNAAEHAVSNTTDKGTKHTEVVQHTSSNVYVDPALYDAFPEEYAKELEEEKKMIEDLQSSGLKRLFRKFSKK